MRRMSYVTVFPLHFFISTGHNQIKYYIILQFLDILTIFESFLFSHHQTKMSRCKTRALL